MTPTSFTICGFLTCLFATLNTLSTLTLFRLLLLFQLPLLIFRFQVAPFLLTSYVLGILRAVQVVSDVPVLLRVLTSVSFVQPVRELSN